MTRRSIEPNMFPRTPRSILRMLSILVGMLTVFYVTNQVRIIFKMDVSDGNSPAFSANYYDNHNKYEETSSSSRQNQQHPNDNDNDNNNNNNNNNNNDSLEYSYQRHEIPLRSPSSTTATIQNSSSSPNNNVRLEFLHIPKTGGSVLEAVAAAQGIVWGYCHFCIQSTNTFLRRQQQQQQQTPRKRRRQQSPQQQGPNVPKPDPKKTMCPPIVGQRVTLWPKDMTGLWHYPLSILEQPQYSTILPSNPYDNLSKDQRRRRRRPPQQEQKRFFTVIRNPYDRIVSEYYHARQFDIEPSHYEELNIPQVMNNDIQWMLSQWIDSDFNHTFQGGHFIPQYDYVFDNKDTWYDATIPQKFQQRQRQQRRVHHVLKYENLTLEFDELMKYYGLNLSLPDLKTTTTTTTTMTSPPPAEYRIRDKQVFNLTSQHLDLSTMRLIEHLYHHDFRLGNYELKSQSSNRS